MNSLEYQLALMRTEYFSIYPDRVSALDQLFGTIGNGYEWKNGKLVNCDEYKKETYKQVDKGKAKPWRSDEPFAPLYEKEIIDMIPKLGFNGCYPLCERNSYCFKYPKNILPEWKEAIIEYLEWVVKLNGKCINPEAEERNVELAKKQLKKLKVNR